MSKKKKEEEMIRKSFVIVLLALVLTIGAVGSASAGMMGMMNLISPATNDLYWDDTNKMLTIGTNNSETKLTVVNEVTTSTRGMLSSQNTSDAASSPMILRKSRGTAASPLSVMNGDYIGNLSMRAFDGTSYLRTANIGTRVDATLPVMTGSVPTEMYFSLSDNDVSDPFAAGTVRMMINSYGNVGIGTTAPTQTLEVNGGMRMNTTATKPACNANARGTFWFIQGSSKDNIEVCVMNGSYMWIQLF